MNEKIIHIGAGTIFGHEINSDQSESQRYTNTVDYYKEVGASYCRQNQKRIQKLYMFEAYILYFVFIYKKVYRHTAKIEFLYFPMYFRE